MLAKLLAPLLHAKIGAISAAILLTISGALVNVSLSNGATQTLTASCTGVTVVPSPASPQAVGTAVVWSASATGCTSPQFRFLLFRDGVWSVVQDWSTTATFTWTTAGLPSTDYQVEIDARAGTSGALEASNRVGYALTPATTAPCTTASISPNPASPQAIGTVVVWTAGATGCVSPQFRFLVWNGSAWTVAQDWSASPTFSWNTSGLAAGSYLVKSQARAGLTGDLQTQSPDTSYTLTTTGTAPCTSVALSPSPASPQVVGTSVLWTASATGCSSPQFRFWLFRDGVWSVVQDWSTSPTFTWNTTGLPQNDYQVEVDARAGTSGGFQASNRVGYTLTATTLTPCTTVSISPSPASPQAVGTAVVWTASATGCASPQFKFLVWNGSAWTVARDWSTSPTFTWNTTGLAAGSYFVKAWARAGTSGDLQVQSADTSYTLTSTGTPPPAPCNGEAAALAFQIQRVNSSFSGFHTSLMALRGQRDAATIEKADRALQVIRHAATKAIHATATASCRKHDDDDNDNDDRDENDNDGENNDHDNSQVSTTATTLSVVVHASNDSDHDGRNGNAGVTFSGTASAIADQAIAAMQVAFNTANNAPVKTAKPAIKTPKVSPTKGPDHKDGHRG
jgi:hypothetical protein